MYNIYNIISNLIHDYYAFIMPIGAWFKDYFGYILVILALCIFPFVAYNSLEDESVLDDAILSLIYALLIVCMLICIGVALPWIILIGLVYLLLYLLKITIRNLKHED